MATADTVTKRIHVGGLTPSITPAHIKDRFKSFGEVTQVEDMPVNGLGDPRPFTFFTIQTSPAQLKKCLSVMSGSTWRGCTLRLAEAKLKYDARLDKERNPPKEVVEDRLRKRKRRVLMARGQDIGKEAQDMRIPDDKTYKTKKFWTTDSDNHLIRPMAIRPTHALPKPLEPGPNKIATSSKPKSTRRLPAKRARIRVINPSRWHTTHLTEKDLPGSSTRGEDGWIFESDEEGEEDEDGRVLVGRWVRDTGGDEQEEEEVWVSGKRVDGLIPEEDDIGLEGLVGAGAGGRDRSVSPLFGARSPEQSASSLFGPRSGLPGQAPEGEEEDQEDSASSTDADPSTGARSGPSRSRSASPLFPTRDREAASPLFPERLRDRKSPSPLFSAHDDKPTAPKPEGPNPETSRDTFTASSLPDPMREIVKAEKSRDLGLLASFLGEELEAAAKPTRGEWAGFDEDEDDDDFEYPLRIRGGKADSEDEDMSDSSSDSDSDSGSSGESDDDDESEGAFSKAPAPASAGTTSAAPTQATSSALPPSAPSAKLPSALKAMFAPAPAQATFSLLGALDVDIELDEELDIPLAPPPVRQIVEPEPELQPLTQTKKSHFDPDPSIPLFFPSFGKGGKDAMREDTEKEGYTGFWRQETDEEMKEIWEKDKVDLTRDWKKRYREGKKQKKRKGGANEVD